MDKRPKPSLPYTCPVTEIEPPQSIDFQLEWLQHWLAHGSDQNLLSFCSNPNCQSVPSKSAPSPQFIPHFLHVSSLIQALPGSSIVISFPRVWISILQVQKNIQEDEERRRTCPKTRARWHWLPRSTSRGMSAIQRCRLLQILWKGSRISSASGRSICPHIWWLKGSNWKKGILGGWSFGSWSDKAPKDWRELV